MTIRDLQAQTITAQGALISAMQHAHDNTAQIQEMTAVYSRYRASVAANFIMAGIIIGYAVLKATARKAGWNKN